MHKKKLKLDKKKKCFLTLTNFVDVFERDTYIVIPKLQKKKNEILRSF